MGRMQRYTYVAINQSYTIASALTVTGSCLMQRFSVNFSVYRQLPECIFAFFYLSIHRLKCPSVYWSVILSTVPICLIFLLSICLCASLFTYMSIYLYVLYIKSNLPSFYLFVYQPIHLSIYLSVCLSLYPIIYPSPQPAAGGVYTQLLN